MTQKNNAHEIFISYLCSNHFMLMFESFPAYVFLFPAYKIIFLAHVLFISCACFDRFMRMFCSFHAHVFMVSCAKKFRFVLLHLTEG